MKKIRAFILSVLLFSFAFLTVHDYVMSQGFSTQGSEISLDKSKLNADKQALNIESQVHENIHTLINAEINDLKLSFLVLNTKPSDNEISLSSLNPHVLERPPLT